MIVHDHRKIHKNIYRPTKGIEVIDTPDMQFVVANGTGPRNVYGMHDGDAIYSISRVINRLKDMTKNEMEYKFTLMPLEIIWHKPVGEDWDWKAMMQVPDIITEEMFETALAELDKRNRSVRVPVTLERIHQGTCVQTTHIGPYHLIEDTVGQTKDYCQNQGYANVGEFREIYINQPFCNPPEKLQTIVRAQVLKG
ncbi:GyrI-like domain-containing protein [Cytobacillus sp. FJAT-54145]|uniref:GyrI-like domain-containing protein n=1 Tax=Cytobacillus spartinae TaxID=3299023 RepID=A0ABW6K7X8_9BACI